MPHSNSPAPYDVAIIGGGVVGCAVARRFALAGAHVVLLEKGADILSGASKANSAILHTGFDAPARQSGTDPRARPVAPNIWTIHRDLGLSLVQTGALVCAWTDAEAEALPPSPIRAARTRRRPAPA